MIKETKKQLRSSGDKNYLSNRDLYREIIVSKAMGKLTPSAQKMLILLGKNLIKRFSYKDEDDKFDCLQSSYLDVFQNWYNFDEEKGDNCFAYFTEIFKRGMAKGWNQATKNKKETISMNSIFEDGGDMNI